VWCLMFGALCFVFCVLRFVFCVLCSVFCVQGSVFMFEGLGFGGLIFIFILLSITHGDSREDFLLGRDHLLGHAYDLHHRIRLRFWG